MKIKNSLFLAIFILFLLTNAILVISQSSQPEEKIQCDKDVYYVDQIIRCSASDCKKGNWFISNLIGEPIKNVTLLDLPPNQIALGPTNEEGIVAINVICFDPSDYYEKRVEVIMGVSLLCDNACGMLKPCNCVIFNCTKGVLEISNYNGTPLENPISKFVNNSPSEITFNTTGEGVVLAKISCFVPHNVSRTQVINIYKTCSGNISLTLKPNITYTSSEVEAIPSGVVNCENKTIYIRRGSCNGIVECNTTQGASCKFYSPNEARIYEYYACIDKNDDNDFLDEGEAGSAKLLVNETPKKVNLGDIECTNSLCKFNITENTINESLSIIAYLIEEPSGKVYFSSLLSTEGFSKGEKIMFLTRRGEECKPGTQLKALIHVYTKSDFTKRIFRTKKAIIC